MPDGLVLASELLPERLRRGLTRMDKAVLERAEEIRLRTGFAASLLLPEGERRLGGDAVGTDELRYVLDRASRSSLHSVQHELRQGFITAPGGVRLGVCGTAAGNGSVEGIRDVSSLAIRIPREVRGAGAEIMDALRPFDRSVLIISPPGGGKTTFLRELIRNASGSGKRVCLCDERGEVAALWRGKLGFDLGECTDILSGVPKAEGLMMLLRGMNPQIIALDEISAAADMEAVEQAAYCGAAVFATAHGTDLETLVRRRHYRALLEGGFFEKAVVISGREKRRYKVVDI